jgi:hypothetical protein
MDSPPNEKSNGCLIEIKKEVVPPRATNSSFPRPSGQSDVELRAIREDLLEAENILIRDRPLHD